MSGDDAKPAQLPGTPQQRWAAGIALCLLGLVGVSVHKQAAKLPPGASIVPGTKLQHIQFADSEGVVSEGADSLEDALKHLEGGHDMEAFPTEAQLEPLAKAMVPKKSRASSRSTKSASTDQKRKKKEQRSAQSSAALDKLDPSERKDSLNDIFQRMLTGDAHRETEEEKAEKEKAQKIIQEAMSNLQSHNKGKEKKPSAEDEKKAKQIINDAMKKLGLPDIGKGKSPLEGLFGGQENGESEDADHTDEHNAHLDFAKKLKEEQQKKIDFTLNDVKKEFKSEFAADAKKLLCSGCKLVASRFGTEIDTHDVHDQENPSAMLTQKRKALDATCTSFRHLEIVTGADGPKFQATQRPMEDHKDLTGQRLCQALLEESKFDLLSTLIQSKVPEMSFFHQQVGKGGHNWERMICAQRARLCKRSEVRDDEDDESDL